MLYLSGRNPYVWDVITQLYSSEILTLASTLQAARLTDPDGTARVSSKLCGSELEIDVAMDGGIVVDVALRVRACALGQASAAILEQGILGATCDEVQAARDALWAMLKEGGDAPEGRFAKLAMLEGVRDYPARHQSVMLAWDGALEAMSKESGGAK